MPAAALHSLVPHHNEKGHLIDIITHVATFRSPSARKADAATTWVFGAHTRRTMPAFV